jgi:protein-tyrosine phosphatase
MMAPAARHRDAPLAAWQRPGAWLGERYGSRRGFLRHLRYRWVESLASGQFVGPKTKIRAERLIFVCQGNICRSALAQAVAERQGQQSLSFGLDTVDGKPADPRLLRVAHEIGYNLCTHGTTPIGRYVPEPGDLVLLMQPDHLPGLLTAVPGLSAPVGLLGSWATPKRPYIHDPFAANDAYMERCARIVEAAVINLAGSLKRPYV